MCVCCIDFNWMTVNLTRRKTHHSPPRCKINRLFHLPKLPCSLSCLISPASSLFSFLSCRGGCLNSVNEAVYLSASEAACAAAFGSVGSPKESNQPSTHTDDVMRAWLNPKHILILTERTSEQTEDLKQSKFWQNEREKWRTEIKLKPHLNLYRWTDKMRRLCFCSFVPYVLMPSSPQDTGSQRFKSNNR